MLNHIKRNILKRTELKRYLSTISHNDDTTGASILFDKNESIPSTSRVVICGSGIIGCSIAYHLSKVKGFGQIVCVDIGQIAETSPGSINSGVIGVTKLSSSESRFAQQSMKVLNELKALGYDTGLRNCGALNLARKKDRMTEFRKIKTQSMSKGITCRLLLPNECLDLCPFLEVSDLEGGILIPDDCIADSKNIALALADQAKKNGVSFIENCRVSKVLVDKKKECVEGVVTDKGTIKCTYFVNCAGLWARQLGQLCEIPVKVPICAVANHVLISKFDKSQNVIRDVPIIRDLDGRIYFRESFGKIYSGGYEKEAKPAFNDHTLPESPSDRGLYADWDHFRVLLKEMLHRIPSLKDASFERLTNIPEAYSYDGLWILGESTEVRNFFVAAGTKTDGISSFGGVGQVISELITKGFASQDFHNLDINRFLGLHNNRRFLRDRAMEVPGRHYAISYPYFGEFKTGRNIRMSPIFPMLKSEGAVFGQTMGYERPFYFDKENITDTTRLMMDTKTFSKPAYFDHVAKEYECCRERVALLDYSSFTKIDLWGNDVVQTLQYLCSNDVDVPVGSIIHTGMQNPYGGYENDCSLARISENYYMMIAPTIQQQRCKNWLKKHIASDARVHFSDVTSKYTAICIMGPFSRNLLSEVTDCDISSQNFPFFSYREIDIGLANGIRALNLTHTGEIGYVCYIPNEFALHVYSTLLEAGNKYDVGLSGYLAMRSLRVEKFYAFWGQDLDTFTTPLECGRTWRVKFNKGDFIGRDALLNQKAEGIKRAYVQLILTDHDADLDVWTSNNGGEPIYRDGKITGYTTTSSYGFTFKTQCCLGFVENTENGHCLPVTTDFIISGDYEVEVAGIRYSAKVNLHSPNLPTKADIPTDRDREAYQATRDKVDDSYFL